ncbi:MAG: anion permease [Oscillospiraceae bacterium]|nr:anion permease [Oscillospiraceae bacterium]
MAQTVITIVIFVAMIISYSLNKIPMALTSMLGMVLLVITVCVAPSSVLSTIGSGTVVTMISMFIIAAGLQRTQMVDKLSGLVYRVSKGSFTRVLAGYVIVTFILGQFLPSTTAIVALVCPLVVSMCREMKVNPSKMLFSIAIVGVAASWTFTPIGPYAANYVESNGMLAEYGINNVSFTIFDEMIDKIPCSIVVILWAIFFAPKFAPDIPDPMIESFTGNVKKEKVPLSPVREVIGYGVFAAVIICLMFNSFGLPSWVIPALGACLVVLSGVLTEKEAINRMGLDIIMIYIGAATLGNAFAATGAGDIIGDAVSAVLGRTHNSYLIGAAFFAAAYIMTSLLYNRAVSKILIPIILLSSISMNCDPRGLMRMCYIGSMCSLITPMATTAVPMIMGAAGYTQKDLLKMNIIPAILMCAVTVLFVMSRFPCY